MLINWISDLNYVNYVDAMTLFSVFGNMVRQSLSCLIYYMKVFKNDSIITTFVPFLLHY